MPRGPRPSAAPTRGAASTATRGGAAPPSSPSRSSWTSPVQNQDFLTAFGLMRFLTRQAEMKSIAG
eukprot:6559761-Alexandrium_andersonii.AAC.1